MAMRQPWMGMPTISRLEWPSEGWFYKQDGQAFGPIPTEQLKELLAAGRVRPRQAVWKKGSHSLLFVHAETAVFDGGGVPPAVPATAP